MLLEDVQDGNLFDDLCKALLVAEHGDDLVLVQDESGDGGLDAYVRSSETLYACYCPGLRTAEATILGKVRRDLAKAKLLRDEKGYSIKRWRLLTPRDLSEAVQRKMRDRAGELGITDATGLGRSHVRDLWLRHGHVQPYFPAFQTEDVLAILREIRAHQVGGDPATRAAGGASAGTGRSWPAPPSVEVQRLRASLGRGAAEAPAEFARLKVISIVGDTLADQLWASLAVLEVMNAIDHQAEIRAGAARLSALSLAAGAPHFGVLADAKLAELLNLLYVFADAQTTNAVRMVSAVGIGMEHVTGDLVDVERVRRLHQEADALLDQLIPRAVALEDSRLLVAVLDVVAEARQRRVEIYSALHPGSELATSERSRALWAFGAQLDLARALKDVPMECIALHHYARALHLAGDSAGPALARRAIDLVGGHGVQVPPGAWTELKAIAAGSRPSHWPPARGTAPS
jgi:hypothetical protein